MEKCTGRTRNWSMRKEKERKTTWGNARGGANPFIHIPHSKKVLLCQPMCRHDQHMQTQLCTGRWINSQPESFNNQQQFVTTNSESLSTLTLKTGNWFSFGGSTESTVTSCTLGRNSPYLAPQYTNIRQDTWLVVSTDALFIEVIASFPDLPLSCLLFVWYTEQWDRSGT